MIDLHSHTTASDGQHSPAELVALAAQAGIKVLAVTDHDTVGGLASADDAARRLGLRLVPGIELSVVLNRREVHVLGHFVERSEERLAAFSNRLRTERRLRMEQMVARMVALGFPVTLDEVLAIAHDGHLTRPHLARMLVERGYCADVRDAFERFLGDGKPAWVERFKLSGADAIALVRDAGGTATVAHPGVSKVERHELVELKEAGLSGVEVFHSDQSSSTREKYLALAKELDLVPTGGSDFHGEKVHPGRHLGDASMPQALFEKLEARATGSR